MKKYLKIFIAPLLIVGLVLLSSSGVNFNSTDNKAITEADLVDIPSDVIIFSLSGSYTTGTLKDGMRTMEKSGTILSVIVSQGQRGNTGDNIYDINKHSPALPITTQRNGTVGTTIYTTQANRPTLVGLTASKTDNCIIQAAAPDVTAFAAGDFFSMDVDLRQASSESIVILIFIKYDF